MWSKFLDSFHRSEVIIWARLQVVLLPIVVGLHDVDWSPYITDRHLLIAYMAINSVTTELLRRRREDWKEDEEK